MRTPWCTLTRASLSGTRAAVRSRFWPMVSPSNATGLAPCTYEGSLATSMAASSLHDTRAPAPFCDDTTMNPARGAPARPERPGTVPAMAAGGDGVSSEAAGRVAVVTGAARGIGAATAIALAEQGWAVLAVDQATDDPALPYRMGTKVELSALADEANQR